MEDKPRRTSERRSGLSGVQIMFAAILSIGLILALNFGSRIAESQPLLAAFYNVRDEIEALRQEQAELTRLRDYVRSDVYVAQWARSEGKMARPGEILVVPVPVVSAVEATPEPEVFFADVQTTPPEPEPWEIWWALFFDSPPPGER
jgi:cell division protein FtsB